MSKRYTFADGRQLRHILGSTWELLTIDGAHVTYLIEEKVSYDLTRRHRPK
jgi:uncharacterized protein YjaG (DUF416 family)